MAEPSEQAPFVTEAICDSRSCDETVEKLDGAAAFEPAVAARCEPHVAHAATADQVIERVTADLFACERRAMTLGEFGYFTGRILRSMHRVRLAGCARLPRSAAAPLRAPSASDHVGRTRARAPDPDDR